MDLGGERDISDIIKSALGDFLQAQRDRLKRLTHASIYIRGLETITGAFQKPCFHFACTVASRQTRVASALRSQRVFAAGLKLGIWDRFFWQTGQIFRRYRFAILMLSVNIHTQDHMCPLERFFTFSIK